MVPGVADAWLKKLCLACSILKRPQPIPKHPQPIHNHLQPIPKHPQPISKSYLRPITNHPNRSLTPKPPPNRYHTSLNGPQASLAHTYPRTSPTYPQTSPAHPQASPAYPRAPPRTQASPGWSLGVLGPSLGVPASPACSWAFPACPRTSAQVVENAFFTTGFCAFSYRKGG